MFQRSYCSWILSVPVVVYSRVDSCIFHSNTKLLIEVQVGYLNKIEEIFNTALTAQSVKNKKVQDLFEFS